MAVETLTSSSSKTFCLGRLIGVVLVLLLLFQELSSSDSTLVLKPVHQLHVIISRTKAPSGISTMSPSLIPSMNPSKIPSTLPTIIPSSTPSIIPSRIPTGVPTNFPSTNPTNIPSQMPMGTMTNFLNKLLFNNNENLLKNFLDADKYIPLYNIDNLRRSRSVVGDVTRLRMFIKKLIIDGQCVEILAVGGSVTQGFRSDGKS